LAWLISHQPAVLFSHNKTASSTLLSEQTSTSHQPPANRTGCLSLPANDFYIRNKSNGMILIELFSQSSVFPCGSAYNCLWYKAGAFSVQVKPKDDFCVRVDF
jgi:hypothetical protein